MITLFPCPYGIDHIRTINDVLGRSFFPLLDDIPYARWKASRKIRAKMLRQLYRLLRNRTDIEGIFFSNLLTDATAELKAAFPEIRILGYVHGTNLSFGENPLASEMYIARERRLYRSADAIFVGSVYLREMLLSTFPELYGKIFVVGFPFDENILLKPTERERIVLYNHRFDKNKQPLQLVPLAEQLPGFSIIATSPNFNPFILGILRKEGIQTHTNPRQEVYEELLDSAMFQVSFARHETFGVATQLAVLRGAFALAPNRASYPEFLPNKMLYDDLEELVGKIRYYEQNPIERFKVVRETQVAFHRQFRATGWLEQVEQHIVKSAT